MKVVEKLPDPERIAVVRIGWEDDGLGPKEPLVIELLTEECVVGSGRPKVGR